MLFGLFGRKNGNRAMIDRQYAALTAAARCPLFYTDFHVPDTVMGRFEMLSVVMILFFRRTARAPASGRQLAQEIVDAFFQDLDHSLRELGIGDQGVPRRMKKLAGMFYGRLESYAAALDAGDRPALAAALARNIHPAAEAAPDMGRLAAWMAEADTALASLADDAICGGRAVLVLPDAPGEAGEFGHQARYDELRQDEHR